MRRSLRFLASCAAALAAVAGCAAGTGAGSGPPQDTAAEVARRLQGDWIGPCFTTEAGPWRRHDYAFTGSDVRFSVWAGCGESAVLLDRAFGTFAIGPRLTAAVPGGGGVGNLDVVAWQLDVTWTTSAVSRTAVALTDPRDPEPYLMFAAWDAEAVSTLVPTRYERSGEPALVFASAVVGTWAHCVSATRADLRAFEVGLLTNPYAEGWFTFEDACLGRRTGTHPSWGVWVIDAPTHAALDGALVTGHVLRHRLDTDDPSQSQLQMGFITRTAGGDTLYLSDPSSNGVVPRRMSSADGAWVKVNYALPPRPPGPMEAGALPPSGASPALSTQHGF